MKWFIAWATGITIALACALATTGPPTQNTQENAIATTSQPLETTIETAFLMRTATPIAVGTIETIVDITSNPATAVTGFVEENGASRPLILPDDALALKIWRAAYPTSGMHSTIALKIFFGRPTAIANSASVGGARILAAT